MKLDRCRRGHDMTPENTRNMVHTYWRKKTGETVEYPDRRCRRCEAVTSLAWQRKRRASGDPRYQEKGHFNRQKTACPYGHAYTPENTKVGKNYRGGLKRECRICRVEWNRRAREARNIRAAAARANVQP